MLKKSVFCLLLLFALVGSAIAQRTTVFTEANLAFSKGVEFFDQGLYAMSQHEFRKVLNRRVPANEPEYRIIAKKAELLLAKSAVRLDQPEGQKLMTDFVKSQRPDPTANQALIELANFYFNKKDYDEAIEFYSMMQETGLTEIEKTEIRFKHGYCLFVKKRFDEARSKLSEVKNIQGDYYFPANYYYGLTSYFNENYDEALASWSVVEDAPAYRKLIPYYIGQIHASRGDYDQLIAYLEPRIEQRGLKNKTEMHHMLGQAYFEQGNFQQALPYLEYYEEKSARLRAQDFYQVALTQYKNEKYEEAAKNFKQLNNENSELGQSAMFYLADSYLRAGDKASARNAFQSVSRMTFDPVQQEEALYHYARLSAELGMDRDAIKSLQRFLPESKYYASSQDILAETLVNTKDYKTAIKLIEKMDQKTPTIKEAYQKVTFYQGIEEFDKKKYGKAQEYFQKSLQNPVQRTIQAQATYWIGEMQHIQGQFAQSKKTFSEYLTVAAGVSSLPATASIGAAHYTQGYNYFKTEDYTAALDHLESSIRTIPSGDQTELGKRARPDAMLRAGDCNFKRNRYSEATNYYDQAITAKAPGFEYALFQKAIIGGLTGNEQGKINDLNVLVNNYPQSAYADDALFELAATYQSMGQFESAVAPLKKLIANYRGKSPLVNRSHLRLGLITYNLGRTQEALGYYKTIFKNNPTSAEAKDAMVAIEEIYVDDLGQPDEYVAFVESVPGYKVTGDERDALNYSVAENHYEQGDYTSAVASFSNYIKTFPKGQNLLNAYYFRGESNTLLKDYDNALTDYLSVVKKGESHLYARAMGKAATISYNHKEDFNQSFELYSNWESLTSDPEEQFEAQIGAMRSAYRIGDKKATALYATKVSSNPKATNEEKAFAQFFEGKLAYEKGQYDAAQQMFKQVVQYTDNEQTAEARYLLADIDFRANKLEEAELACRNAFSESAAYPFWVAKSLILLSDVLVKKSDLFNAKAALEAVVENFTEDESLVAEARAKIKAIEQLESQQNRLTKPAEGSNLLQLDQSNSNQ